MPDLHAELHALRAQHAATDRRLDELAKQVAAMREVQERAREDILAMVDLFRASRSTVRVIRWIGSAIAAAAGLYLAIRDIWPRA